jgi:manganese transport protein
MQDFTGFAIPLWLRRVVTMLPAFVIVGWGVDATRALVLSQVVLSLVVPVPMIALVVFACRSETMGVYRLRPATAALAGIAALAVIAMNGVLVALAF